VCSNVFTVEIVIGCESLKKKKSQGKAVEVTANSKNMASRTVSRDLLYGAFVICSTSV
jgi:hypothetical protein